MLHSVAFQGAWTSIVANPGWRGCAAGWATVYNRFAVSARLPIAAGNGRASSILTSGAGGLVWIQPQRWMLDVGCSMFIRHSALDVQCSMFDVHPASSLQPPASSLQPSRRPYALS